MIKEKCGSERKYKNTSFYCASLYGVLQMLHFPKKNQRQDPPPQAKAFQLALVHSCFSAVVWNHQSGLPVTELAGLWKTIGWLAESKYCHCREHSVLSAVQQLSSFRQR